MGFSSDMRAAAAFMSSHDYLKSQLPYIPGTWYFIDGDDGSDLSGRNGQDPDAPLATLSAAYGKCTSGSGDGICFFSRSTSSGSNSIAMTAALTWAKYGITVVGISAPTSFFGRARLYADATADLASLITVTGQNNRFINLTISQEGDASTAIRNVIITGARNTWEGCHLNLSHATPALTTDASVLDLRGSENVFRGCTFGSNNTVWAADDNGQITFSTTQGGQNLFDGCRVYSRSSTAGHNAVYFAMTGAMGGWTTFSDCQFVNFAATGGALTALTAVFGGEAQTKCGILVHNCSEVGWAAWSVLASKVYVACSGETAAGAGGIATAPAA